MEKVILKTQSREDVGKKAAKNLRKIGLIPAVVYRGGKEATNLTLAVKEFKETIHTKAGVNVVITLKVQNPAEPIKDKTVIIKEIQRDPVTDEILHVDFNEISLTETLKVNVPLVDKGEPAGVKQDGGVLEHVLWELQVECLPTAIPEKIECEVSGLKIGDSILVKQIALPEGVKVLNDPDLIAMIVKPPHIEKPKEEVVEEVAEPELIREKKEKEEEEEAEEGGKPEKASGKEEKK